MFGTVLRAQTTTFPRNGVQDERPNTYAFVNATIVSDANTVLEGATLVIKGSVIEAIGKNITLPAGTQVIDLKGKRIYPSLVEAYSSYGMPELKNGELSFTGEIKSKSGITQIAKFNLKATNGQVILASEGYATKAACENGIESVRKNAQVDARFDRLEAKNGKPYFNLKATNGQIIGNSEM